MLNKEIDDEFKDKWEVTIEKDVKVGEDEINKAWGEMKPTLLQEGEDRDGKIEEAMKKLLKEKLEKEKAFGQLNKDIKINIKEAIAERKLIEQRLNEEANKAAHEAELRQIREQGLKEELVEKQQIKQNEKIQEKEIPKPKTETPREEMKERQEEETSDDSPKS